ncbi:OmpA/MotB family protein [Hydrogenophaga aquatica]
MSDSLLHRMIGKAQQPAEPPAPPPLPEPVRRRAMAGGRFARWHMDAPAPQEEETWLITYLDVVTLLLAMLVVMLAFSEPISRRHEGGERREVASATQGANAEGSTIVPPIPLPMPVQGKSGQPVDGPQNGQKDGAASQGSGQADPLAGLPLGELGQSIEVVKGEGVVRFRISSELLFASGEAGLTPAGQTVIDQLLPALNRVPDYTIVVEGHTDNVPIQTARFPSNWELAAGRAGSVVRHLQSRGLNPTRLRASGYADTRPIASNATPEGRAANRRVEITMESPQTTR